MENEKKKVEFVAPEIGLSDSPEVYSELENYYNNLLKKENKTDSDKLNIFLIQIALVDRVGIRRKILNIRKYLDVISQNLNNK